VLAAETIHAETRVIADAIQTGTAVLTGNCKSQRDNIFEYHLMDICLFKKNAFNLIYVVTNDKTDDAL